MNDVEELYIINKNSNHNKLLSKMKCLNKHFIQVFFRWRSAIAELRRVIIANNLNGFSQNWKSKR